MPSTTLTRPPDAAGLVAEVVPLIAAIPVAGPPAIVLVGPLVLLGLAVAGPFVLMVTLAVCLLVAVALIAIGGAILASPFLLVHYLRGLAARRARPSAQLRMVPARSRQGIA
jgi:hypothetical protein